MMRYLFYGVDHWTYFPLIVSVAAIATLILSWRYSVQVGRTIGKAWWIIPCLAILSIFVFRTEYPNYHGDGEMGVGDKITFSWKEGDSVIGNLRQYQVHNLIMYASQRIFTNPPAIFKYHYMAAYHHPNGADSSPLENLLMMQSMAQGIIIALVLALVVLRMKSSGAFKFGLLLLLLASEPMLSAYGHFDSYIEPVLCFTMWAIAFAWSLNKPLKFLVLPLALSGLCVVGHPLMFTVPIFTVLSPLRDKVSGKQAAIAGLAASCLILVTGYSIRSGYNLDSSLRMILAKAHSVLMSIAQTSIPSLALLWMTRKKWENKALVCFLITSSLGLFVMAHIQWFILDEFVTSVIACPMIFAAVLSLKRDNQDEKSLVRAALLSAFLFIPAMIVYSGDKIIDRWEALIPHEVSANTMSYSPTVLLGSRACVDTEELRARKVEYFRQGWKHPKKPFENLAGLNMLYYAAWCLEFGYKSEAYAAMVEMTEMNPMLLNELFMPGVRFTWRYKNQAYIRARLMAIPILKDYCLKHPDDKNSAALLSALIGWSRSEGIRE